MTKIKLDEKRHNLDQNSTQNDLNTTQNDQNSTKNDTKCPQNDMKCRPLEEEELVFKAKSGDIEAQNALFALYKQTINHTARKYFLSGGDVEDLVQEGMLGLYKAMLTFEKKQASFKTYACVCIRHQIQNAVKMASSGKNRALSDAVSLQEKLGAENDDEAEVMLPSNEPTPEERLRQKEDEEELTLSLKKLLTPLEFSVLGKYLEGYNYAEIAASLGISKKSIDNALSRIKAKAAEIRRLNTVSNPQDGNG